MVGREGLVGQIRGNSEEVEILAHGTILVMAVTEVYIYGTIKRLGNIWSGSSSVNSNLGCNTSWWWTIASCPRRTDRCRVLSASCRSTIAYAQIPKIRTCTSTRALQYQSKLGPTR